MYFFLVFFFKQKTAYEMRISDWSSDVCSSDLFSVRSSAENPRFLLMPRRMLSPSRRYARRPCACNTFSSATATVLLPEPDRPVNQIVAPFWPSSWLRSARVTSPSCQVTLVDFCSVIVALEVCCGGRPRRRRRREGRRL